MNSDAWTFGNDWQAMLRSLPAAVNRRKLRLWSVAWARDILAHSSSHEFNHVRGWFSPAALDEHHRELDAAEQYADGGIGRAALHAAKARSGGPWNPFHIPSGMTRLNSDTIRTVLAQFIHEFKVPTDRTLGDLLRDVFGNPFHSVTLAGEWRTAAAVGLAQTMYDTRDFGAMPVLADVLEEAGCDQPDIFAHCRGPGPHVRGCWVVDLVLGKS